MGHCDVDLGDVNLGDIIEMIGEEYLNVGMDKYYIVELLDYEFYNGGNKLVFCSKGLNNGNPAWFRLEQQNIKWRVIT